MRILTTLALKGVLDVLRPELEKAAGGPLDLVLQPTAVMLERIAAGERGDVCILTTQGIERLIADGTVEGASRTDLARSLVGLAVRTGAPKPDISSVDGLKRTLLGARSVCYSRTGASGIFFAGLIGRLGIAEAVNAKALIIPSGFTAEAVASGKAEVAVQQISELMTVAGVDIAGPFPAGAQESLMFSGAVVANSRLRDAGARLLRVLSDPAHAPAFERTGLVPLDSATLRA